MNKSKKNLAPICRRPLPTLNPNFLDGRIIFRPCQVCHQCRKRGK